MNLQKIILTCLRDEVAGKPITTQHLLKIVGKASSFRYDEFEVKREMWKLIVSQRIILTPDRKIKFERMY